MAKLVELCKSVNEGRVGEQVGLWNRIENEVCVVKTEIVGVEREELGGEIGITGEASLEYLGMGLTCL